MQVQLVYEWVRNVEHLNKVDDSRLEAQRNMALAFAEHETYEEVEKIVCELINWTRQMGKYQVLSRRTTRIVELIDLMCQFSRQTRRSTMKLVRNIKLITQIKQINVLSTGGSTGCPTGLTRMK
jgi:hypothetical protein